METTGNIENKGIKYIINILKFLVRSNDSCTLKLEGCDQNTAMKKVLIVLPPLQLSGTVICASTVLSSRLPVHRNNISHGIHMMAVVTQCNILSCV